MTAYLRMAADHGITVFLYPIDGSTIGKDDVWVKRPGTGIPARQLQDVIGKTATRAITKDQLIRWEDVA